MLKSKMLRSRLSIVLVLAALIQLIPLLLMQLRLYASVGEYNNRSQRSESVVETTTTQTTVSNHDNIIILIENKTKNKKIDNYSSAGGARDDLNFDPVLQQLPIVARIEGVRQVSKHTRPPTSAPVTENVTLEIRSARQKQTVTVKTTTTTTTKEKKKKKKKTKKKGKKTKNNERVDIVENELSETKFRIQQWNGTMLDSVIKKWWHGNYLCQTELGGPDDFDPAALERRPPSLLNISFGCRQQLKEGRWGTGNYIWALYAYRWAAQLLNMDIHISCPDAVEERANTVLPWLAGYFPATSHPSLVKELLSRNDSSLVASVCGTSRTSPIGFMVERIRHEFRRMAVAFVGIPHPDHPSARFAKEWLDHDDIAIGMSNNRSLIHANMTLPMPKKDDTPLLPRLHSDLDDVMIHFRCGDLMDTDHRDYGFMKFTGYTARIPSTARSIGIATQPFDVDLVRKEDQNTTRRCRTVVTSMVGFLQERFPAATIRVHNSRNETLPMTFARMVMAETTIVGLSSFSVFAAIASFGKGYITTPTGRMEANLWLLLPSMDPPPYNDIVLIKEPLIPCAIVQRMWEDDPTGTTLLSWFRGESNITLEVIQNVTKKENKKRNKEKKLSLTLEAIQNVTNKQEAKNKRKKKKENNKNKEKLDGKSTGIAKEVLSV